MAEHLIGYRRAVSCASAFMTMASACCMGSASAGELPDPTRPPSAIARPASAIGDVVGMTADGEPADTLRLQSVIVSSGRKLAVINGKIVRQGEKVGDAVVAKITESGVTLRRGKDLQELKLFPGLEKRAGSAPADAKSSHRQR